MKTLISATILKSLIADPQQSVLLVDCRFNLADTTEGERLFSDSHLDSAIYLHIDRDLSGPIIPGVTGRHPLPDKATFSALLKHAGAREDTLIVAYDASGGAFASRLWWLAQWSGFRNCAVLDGGMQAWEYDESPIDSLVEHPSSPVEIISAEEIRNTDAQTLVDARDEERYRGEVEPIDPVAGHIPGAICLPFAENLDNLGYFLPPDELKIRFENVFTLLGQPPVMYCGSGVTAAHNCLAAVHAGYAMPKLYPGSWSEWITDPSRPIATGE